MAKQKVAGTTYCLRPFDGKIFAGADALVIVYSLLEERTGPGLRLMKESLHHGHIVAYRI